WGSDGRSLEFLSPESTNVTRLALEGFDEKSKGLEHGGFTPDWKMLFAMDGLGRVLVWEVATGKVLKRLQGPPPPLSAGVISRRYLPPGAVQAGFVRFDDLRPGRQCRRMRHQDR